MVNAANKDKDFAWMLEHQRAAPNSGIFPDNGGRYPGRKEGSEDSWQDGRGMRLILRSIIAVF